MSDFESFGTGRTTGSGRNDNCDSTMAISTMVPHTTIHGPQTPLVASKQKESADKSKGGMSSFKAKLLSKPSGLAGLREKLEGEGLSSRSNELILSARREGTTRNYESTWKQWVLWCSGRGLDPSSCPIVHVLDYLADLFQKGFQYRYIGVHRSAISRYHDPVVFQGGLTTVGKHPRVSELMSGISNKRPPKPRYSFTWDVERVLSVFRSWPETLTAKQLSVKTVTLLSLIGIPRGAEIHQFDLRYLSKFNDRYVFSLTGTAKNISGGKKPTPIEFHKHVEDSKLCPLTCIDTYIALTAPWRPGGTPSEFFLSYIKPHGPITKSRLAGWVKEALLLGDVDKTFRAHSVRGAASAKAFLKGLSVKDILEHGSWSRESTWQRFYHREVHYPSKNFQEGILKL